MEKTELKTEQRIVGFVDILGFKGMIEKYDKGENPEILRHLVDAMNEAMSYLKSNPLLTENIDPPFFVLRECLEAKVFSDNLCLSVPLEYKSFKFFEQLNFFYKYISKYQEFLFKLGIFTRGGVEMGSYYSDENLIFSGGLVEAYYLEQKATYPRIILGKKILEQINNLGKAHRKQISLMIMQDENSIAFFNPFNYLLVDSAIQDEATLNAIKTIGAEGYFLNSFEEQDTKIKIDTLVALKATIELILGKISSESISEKYQWLIDFIRIEMNEKVPNRIIIPYYSTKE